MNMIMRMMGSPMQQSASARSSNRSAEVGSIELLIARHLDICRLRNRRLREACVLTEKQSTKARDVAETDGMLRVGVAGRLRV